MKRVFSIREQNSDEPMPIQVQFSLKPGNGGNVCVMANGISVLEFSVLNGRLYRSRGLPKSIGLELSEVGHILWGS